MARIAVSLSGGGYRASLFGLGVLLYLTDADRNREVGSISSVSGGSITNAFVGQAGGYATLGGADFRAAVRPMVRVIANSTLWASPLVWTYLVLLLGYFPAVAWIAFRVAPWALWVRLLLFVVLLVPWGWALQQRGVMAGRAMASKLFSPHGGLTRLGDIETGIDARAARARAAMGKLGDAASWTDVIDKNQRVATTLSALGAEVTGRLLRHGYATAMANLHTILDYPLIDLPDQAAFETLAR